MPEPMKDVATLKCRCGNMLTVSRQFIGSYVTCYACGMKIAIRKPGDGAAASSPAAPEPVSPAPVACGVPAPVPVQVMPPAPPAPSAVTQVIVMPQQVPAMPGLRIPSGIPSAERTIWEGRPALAYHLPGMVWSGMWIMVWVVLAACAGMILSWLQSKAAAAPAVANVDTSFIKPIYLSLVFLAFAGLAGLKLARRILAYLNAYYVFTTQRIRLRQGIFSRMFAQMELYRVKDYRVWETLWGRLMNYAHVRIVSSDPLVNDVALFGVPGGVKTVEQIRLAAQQYRAESGVMMIHE